MLFRKQSRQQLFLILLVCILIVTSIHETVEFSTVAMHIYEKENLSTIQGFLEHLLSIVDFWEDSHCCSNPLSVEVLAT